MPRLSNPRPSNPGLVGLLAVLALAATQLGCASATKATFQDSGLTAATKEQALRAATAAIGATYQNVRTNRRGTVVTADPLYVDFGQTELDAVSRAIEQPTEVTQVLGRVRRVPQINIVSQGDAFGFEVRVQREVEEVESGYVAYDTPYDLNEHSSMVTDPSAYSTATQAPPREEWIPQGNDLMFESRLKQALSEQLRR